MTPHAATVGTLAALTCLCAGAAAAQSVAARNRSMAGPASLSAPAAGEHLAVPVLAAAAVGADGRWSPAATLVTPLASAAADGSGAAPVQNPEGQRLREFVYDIIGPGAIVGTVVAAASLQAINDPSQWGGGWSGFWRRAASTEGQIVAQETMRYWTAIAMNRSTRYQRCNCTGFDPRVRHAFMETFTDRDAAGRRAFSYARVVGAFGGSAVRMVWWPDPTVGRAAAGGAVSLLFTFVGNVMTEYTGLRF